MLDSARQILRYSVPGWLYIVFLAMLFSVEWIVRGVGAADDPIIVAAKTIDKSSISGILLIIAAIGIPVGYLIYQAYYFGYWRGFEIERHKPHDKGMAVLMGINIDTNRWFWTELELPANKKLDPNGDGYNRALRWKAFKEKKGVNSFFELFPFIRTRANADRYKRNWFLAESIFYKTILSNENAKYWEDRATFMADVYHSLNAVRVGLVLAIFTYIGITYLYITKSWTRDPGWYNQLLPIMIGAFIIDSVWAFLSYRILKQNAMTTRENLITLKRHAIIAYNQQEKAFPGRTVLGFWLQNKQEVERLGLPVLGQIPLESFQQQT